MGERFWGFNNASTLAFVILVINVIVGSATPPLSGLGEEHASYHRQRLALSPGFRLPKTVVPKHYDCELWIILDDDPTVGARFTAPGKVKIEAETDENTGTKKIVMHSVGINITDLTVTDQVTGVKQTVVNYTLEEDTTQFLNINLENALLPKTKYDIYMEFVTPIVSGNTTQFGLYRSSYINNEGVERFMAVTDFESVDARRMVPCFDEPAMKATWTMSIIRKKTYKSLANMILVSTSATDLPEWERDLYERTVVMPTYLLALTVSDYTSATAPSADFNKPVKVWGPPPLMEAPNNGGVYSASISGKLMDYFEKYLNHSYTLPKMDEFAIPQFSAGAMENWGLNTYRIVRLMYIKGSSTIQDKVSMTNTIAHELAHQWFGNLVTMKWWDDIWLNEGFATYFANLAVSSDTNPVIHPEFGFNDYVVVDSIQYAMQVDVRGTTHPLHYANLSTPAETRFGFDTISYDKGCSILRMTNAFLTEELFVKGLDVYLTTHQNGNAEQEELFAALQSPANNDQVAARLPEGVSVALILRTWTNQAGFPLIVVKRGVGTVSEITITQEPFANDTGIKPAPATWYVPITYKTPSKPYVPADAPEWLLPAETSKVLKVSVNEDEYILLNPEQTSYYRVRYDEANVKLLLSALESNHSQFDVKTRSALVDDNLNLAFNDYQNISTGLNFTKYLKKETEFVPWATFVTNMARSYRLLSRTGAFYYFRKYIKNLMEPTLNVIKLEPQPSDNINVANTFLLRNRLFEWACNVGSEDCINYSKQLVTSWIDNTTALPVALVDQPDLRPFVYCTAVANADNKDQVFNFVLEQFKKSDRETDQLSLVKALACSKEPRRLKGLLDMAANSSDTTFDAYRVVLMQAVAGNSVGPDVVMKYLLENLDQLIATGGASMVSSIISTLSSYISTKAEQENIDKFVQINDGKLDSVKASLATSRLNIEDNIKWTQALYAEMRSWLSANSNN